MNIAQEQGIVRVRITLAVQELIDNTIPSSPKFL
jgi:hypothetical protein